MINLNSTKIDFILHVNVLPFFSYLIHREIIIRHIDADVEKPEPVDANDLTFRRAVVCYTPLAPRYFLHPVIFTHQYLFLPNSSLACP